MHDRSQIITVDDLKNLMGELKGMAHRLLRTETRPQSLTPTALAISALRRAKAPEVDWDDMQWQNRRVFFGVIKMAMKHAVIDHARRAKARGRNNLVYVPGDESILTNLAEAADKLPDAVIALEEALARIRADEANARLAEVTEQYYYAGYTVPQIAAFHNISEKTVDRDLARGRLLLQKLMTQLFRPATPAEASGSPKPANLKKRGKSRSSKPRNPPKTP